MAKPSANANNAEMTNCHNTGTCKMFGENHTAGTSTAMKIPHRSHGSDLNGMPMMRTASRNCKADTTNCVQKLATAEPHACIRGISNRLTVTLMTMPTTAMRLPVKSTSRSRCWR